MNLHVSGINYKTASIDVREKLNFSADGQKAALSALRALPLVEECVLLSTCNRTEVYIYSESPDFSVTAVENLLCSLKGISHYDAMKYFYTYQGTQAVRHLFRVASGLDSMVLGEDQILGQVKACHLLAREAQTLSGVLNTLFRDAITAAKKIKTSTGLSRNPVSVGSLAARHASDFFNGDLNSITALIIGAGSTGSLVLKNLCDKAIGKVYVTSRSHGKTEEILHKYPQVIPISYDNRYDVMDTCDLVISSTSSPHYTVTRDRLEASLVDQKPRLFIDLAVPRDIDESIAGMPGISCMHMDCLDSVIEDNMNKKRLEAIKAEDMIEALVVEFEKNFAFRKALPMVQELKQDLDRLIGQRLQEPLQQIASKDASALTVNVSDTVHELLDQFLFCIRETGRKEDISAFVGCLNSMVKEKIR